MIEFFQDEMKFNNNKSIDKRTISSRNYNIYKLANFSKTFSTLILYYNNCLNTCKHTCTYACLLVFLFQKNSNNFYD